MRCLERNKTKIFYSSYLGKTEILDDYGNKTGEYDFVYSKPQELYAYISPSVGEVEERRFGETLAYDRTIVLDNYYKDTINEQTRFWVETTPELDELGNLKLNTNDEVITPHDYLVKRVSKSLNSVLISIKRVNVSD